jgi:ribosomal protein S18 acetylase RimI-like enzyme
MKLSQFLKRNKVSHSEVSSNVVFKKLTEGLQQYEKNPEFDYIVETRTYGLELSEGLHFNSHNGIAISVGEIALIFINSYGDSGLEISHLWVSPIQQRMGLGTRLVREVFNLCQSIIGHIPKISLECTGNTTHNGKWYTTGISGQTAFYRKFGFRVSDRKKYPLYVRMERSISFTCNEMSQRNVNVFEQRIIDNLQSAA